MLGGGLQLALIPAPLIVAALVVFALTPRQAGVACTVARPRIVAPSKPRIRPKTIDPSFLRSKVSTTSIRSG